MIYVQMIVVFQYPIRLAFLFVLISFCSAGQTPQDEHEFVGHGEGLQHSEPASCLPQSLVAPTGLYEIEYDNGMMLRWDIVPVTFSCQVRGGVVGGTIAYKLVEGYEPKRVFVSYQGMTSGAMYEWQVRCACKLDPLTWGPYSEIKQFRAPFFDLPYDPDQANKIVLFPNPANEIINIHYNKEVDINSMIEIYDLNGTLVIEEFLRSGLNMINSISLEKGYYVAVVSGPDDVTRIPFAKL
ncbi:MAG: T9SS type A sorting domain-containing protein [Flavobacteriales bacterium]|nr:T9SS type A sorting domain-containing protein [Flavobacteriales bacterium]